MPKKNDDAMFGKFIGRNRGWTTQVKKSTNAAVSKLTSLRDNHKQEKVFNFKNLGKQHPVKTPVASSTKRMVFT